MTGSDRARLSVVLGVLATLTMPVAIVATRYSDSYELVHTGFAIPIAVTLGIAAVVLARRARLLGRATLGRVGGARSARAGGLLGILGLCLASSSAIAFAVYGVLLALD